MRNAVTVVSLLSFLLHGAVAAGDQPERPIRLVDALLVNAANAERNVTHGLCRDEGVRQIARLLRSSKVEEMWAFLPRGRPGGTCQWHEIGRNEISGADRALVSVDWTYLEALMTENDALHLYHFHPLAFFAYASSAPADGSDEALRRAIISDLRFSMPSPADIHFMMETTSRFHRHHPRHGEIRNSVVTPYGIVDYALTDAGRVKYESDKDARTQGLYIKYVAASKLDDESIDRIVTEHPHDIARCMRRLADSLNTRHLRIELSAIAEN